MGKNYRMVFMKDFEDAGLQECLSTIREKNDLLYKKLLHALKQRNFLGIREDVLRCFADNADSIKQDNQFVFHLISLTADERIVPDYYSWLIEYCKNTFFEISDIITSFTVAIDKGMPLEDLQKCFEHSDFLTVFEHIEQYGFLQTQSDGLNAVTEEVVSLPLVKDSNEDTGLVSVFGDLFTVMAIDKRGEEDRAVHIQKRFYEALSALRKNVDDINSFFGDIIHEGDTDKEVILRLKAIYNIQQRVLSSQHQKLCKADKEICRLEAALRDAEKREFYYEAINNKVRDIQTLTASIVLRDERSMKDEEELWGK